jgi:hypothetical protein
MLYYFIVCIGTMFTSIKARTFIYPKKGSQELVM